MSKEKIKLSKKDSALVLRKDGTLEVFVPKVGNDQESAADNVTFLMLAALLAEGDARLQALIAEKSAEFFKAEEASEEADKAEA